MGVYGTLTWVYLYPMGVYGTLTWVYLYPMGVYGTFTWVFQTLSKGVNEAC